MARGGAREGAGRKKEVEKNKGFAGYSYTEEEYNTIRGGIEKYKNKYNVNSRTAILNLLGGVEMKKLNLKWVVIAEKGGDEFVEVYQDQETAFYEGVRAWERLTSGERKKQKIMIALANIDESGNYMELENGDIDADLREVFTVNKDFVEDYWMIKG